MSARSGMHPGLRIGWSANFPGYDAMLGDADIRFLKENVFAPVAERVKDRRDSLSGIARFLSCGIGFEGWFKVEALGALGSQVKRLCNEGPDLELVNGVFIELKTSAS